MGVVFAVDENNGRDVADAENELDERVGAETKIICNTNNNMILSYGNMYHPFAGLFVFRSSPTVEND